MNFNVGDVVELKSGGPNMTITSISDTKEKALCEWFNQTGSVYEHKQHVFAVGALKKHS